MHYTTVIIRNVLQTDKPIALSVSWDLTLYREDILGFCALVLKSTFIQKGYNFFLKNIKLDNNMMKNE